MDEYGQYQDAWHPDTTYKFIYGVVRLLSTGPEILHDGNHVSNGIQSTEINGSTGYLDVHHDGTLPVGIVQVTVDETLASRGIICGASGGASTVRIRFWENGAVLDPRASSDYDKLSGSSSNIWVLCVYPLERGTGDADSVESQIQDLQTENNELRQRIEGLEPFHPLLEFDDYTWPDDS